MTGFADPVAQRRIEQLEAEVATLKAREIQTYEDGEASGYADWHFALSEYTQAEDTDTPQEVVGYITRLEAERDELRAKVARLAVTVLAYAHDAHPVYSNTTGWRGGIGGQALTPGCSVINPPPGDEGALWELEVPTGEARNVLRELQVDYQAVRAELREAWVVELAGFMQKPAKAPLTPSEPSPLPDAPGTPNDATGGAE